jgi:chemotaxis methyl-accepting protein methylase
VIKDEYDNRPDDRDEHAVEIEASDPRRTKLRKEEAANYRANDAEDDIEDETLARFVDDFASNKPGDKAKDDPSDNRHV